MEIYFDAMVQPDEVLLLVLCEERYFYGIIGLGFDRCFEDRPPRENQLYQNTVDERALKILEAYRARDFKAFTELALDLCALTEEEEFYAEDDEDEDDGDWNPFSIN